MTSSCMLWDTITHSQAFVQDVLPYLDSLQRVNGYQMDLDYLEFYKYPVSYLECSFYFYRYPFYLSHPQYGVYIRKKDKGFAIKQYNELLDSLVSFVKEEDFPDRIVDILKFYDEFPYKNEADETDVLYDQGSFVVMSEGFPYRYNEYKKYRVYYPIIHSQCDKKILPDKLINDHSGLVNKWQEFAFGHACDYIFYLLAETESFKIGLLENQFGGKFAYSVLLIGDKIRIYEIEDMLDYCVRDEKKVLTKKDCSSPEYVLLINDIIGNTCLTKQDQYRLVNTIMKIRESIRIIK